MVEAFWIHHYINLFWKKIIFILLFTYWILNFFLLELRIFGKYIRIRNPLKAHLWLFVKNYNFVNIIMDKIILVLTPLVNWKSIVPKIKSLHCFSIQYTSTVIQVRCYLWPRISASKLSTGSNALIFWLSWAFLLKKVSYCSYFYSLEEIKILINIKQISVLKSCLLMLWESMLWHLGHLPGFCGIITIPLKLFLKLFLTFAEIEDI